MTKLKQAGDVLRKAVEHPAVERPCGGGGEHRVENSLVRRFGDRLNAWLICPSAMTVQARTGEVSATSTGFAVENPIMTSPEPWPV